MSAIKPSDKAIERTYQAILHAALTGARCPANISKEVPDGILDHSAVPVLCRAGRIKVEISGRNYRQVTILDGPHAGKKTAPNPSGAKPWKTIGTETVLDTSVMRRTNESERQTPSLAKINILAAG